MQPLQQETLVLEEELFLLVDPVAVADFDPETYIVLKDPPDRESFQADYHQGVVETTAFRGHEDVVLEK